MAMQAPESMDIDAVHANRISTVLIETSISAVLVRSHFITALLDQRRFTVNS
ncbi:MAG: hypothetical protein ACI9WS_002950 [Paraglaciecola psychrophila]|jgi:hypothetical protein